MTRVGIGYDVHRLAEGRRLVLGGVEIEHDRGLLGHSDADALTHAIIDALLGALGLEDIGALFPDTDEQFKDADSLDLLRAVAAEVERSGATIASVDTTVVIEKPKLAPHRTEMRARLAEALGIDPMLVNVKATRGEGMGFVGREEGVAAMAVAALDPAP
jgi:2-C-methyl-D-erythritol 2,4-cyclodiphosphate synthase